MPPTHQSSKVNTLVTDMPRSLDLSWNCGSWLLRSCLALHRGKWVHLAGRLAGWRWRCGLGGRLLRLLLWLLGGKLWLVVERKNRVFIKSALWLLSVAEL